MSTLAVAETARAAARVRSLDLLRLAAALQMVQGHTIDAVLAPEWRAGAVHAAWLWLRGLTSVAFLFAAGASFQLATLRRFDAHRADSDVAGRRLRRALWLVLLGYALHAPVSLPFVSDPARAAQLVRGAFAADVLQCIGVCLLLLEALTWLLPSAQAVERGCALLAAGLLCASPFSARLEPGAWFPLLAYVTPRGGALFPLTPWAAHVFFGAAFARPLLSSHARASRTAIAAAALIATGTALPASLAPIPDHLTRLGCVLASLSLLTLLERAARRLPAWAWELSSETLFIYASHVLFVYGQGVGLAALVGPSYAPLPSVLLATGMIALSFGGALLYRRFSAGLARGTATG